MIHVATRAPNTAVITCHHGLTALPTQGARIHGGLRPPNPPLLHVRLRAGSDWRLGDWSFQLWRRKWSGGGLGGLRPP